MKYMCYAVVVALLVFTVSIPMGYCGNSNAVYKENLKKIALGLVDQSGKPGESCLVLGNILKGVAEHACSASREEALKKCEEACGKKGISCEELFTVLVKNKTQKSIRLFLYHPKTLSFSPKKALLTWDLEPGDETMLSVDDEKLYLTGSFYMGAKVLKGTVYWETRRLNQYSIDVAILKKMRRMSISLVITK